MPCSIMISHAGAPPVRMPAPWTYLVVPATPADPVFQASGAVSTCSLDGRDAPLPGPERAACRCREAPPAAAARRSGLPSFPLRSAMFFFPSWARV